MPIVSIVIPVYNTSRYIKRCLDSVCNQTLKDIEIIIVDDGSTDNSDQIYSSYIDNYPNFFLIKKENGGLSSARFSGFKIANGEFIVFVDSDDYIEPTYCEDLYNACISNNCDIAICGYNTINSYNIKFPQPLCYTDNVIRKAGITSKYILPLIAYSPKSKYNIPSFLWMRMMKRKYIIEDCFIHENEVFSEDLVFNLNYITNRTSIAVVNKQLYNYCYNENSLTNRYRNNGWKMRLNLYDICVNYCKSQNINDDIRLRNHLFGAILYGIQNASHLSFGEFNEIYDDIRNNVDVRSLINNINIIDYFRLIRNYKILFILLKFFHSRFVYKFYRWRQLR